jgi:hypothetical protein
MLVCYGRDTSATWAAQCEDRPAMLVLDADFRKRMAIDDLRAALRAAG